jgi:hypothetical protein
LACDLEPLGAGARHREKLQRLGHRTASARQREKLRIAPELFLS